MSTSSSQRQLQYLLQDQPYVTEEQLDTLSTLQDHPNDQPPLHRSLQESSSTTIYIIGGSAFLVVFGALALFFYLKKKRAPMVLSGDSKTINELEKQKIRRSQALNMSSDVERSPNSFYSEKSLITHNNISPDQGENTLNQTSIEHMIQRESSRNAVQSIRNSVKKAILLKKIQEQTGSSPPKKELEINVVSKNPLFMSKYIEQGFQGMRNKDQVSEITLNQAYEPQFVKTMKVNDIDLSSNQNIVNPPVLRKQNFAAQNLSRMNSMVSVDNETFMNGIDGFHSPTHKSNLVTQKTSVLQIENKHFPQHEDLQTQKTGQVFYFNRFIKDNSSFGQQQQSFRAVLPAKVSHRKTTTEWLAQTHKTPRFELNIAPDAQSVDTANNKNTFDTIMTEQDDRMSTPEELSKRKMMKVDDKVTERSVSLIEMNRNTTPEMGLKVQSHQTGKSDFVMDEKNQIEIQTDDEIRIPTPEMVTRKKMTLENEKQTEKSDKVFNEKNQIDTMTEDQNIRNPTPQMNARQTMARQQQSEKQTEKSVIVLDERNQIDTMTDDYKIRNPTPEYIAKRTMKLKDQSEATDKSVIVQNNMNQIDTLTDDYKIRNPTPEYGERKKIQPQAESIYTESSIAVKDNTKQINKFAADIHVRLNTPSPGEIEAFEKSINVKTQIFKLPIEIDNRKPTPEINTRRTITPGQVSQDTLQSVNVRMAGQQIQKIPSSKNTQQSVDAQILGFYGPVSQSQDTQKSINAKVMGPQISQMSDTFTEESIEARVIGFQVPYIQDIKTTQSIEVKNMTNQIRKLQSEHYTSNATPVMSPKSSTNPLSENTEISVVIESKVNPINKLKTETYSRTTTPDLYPRTKLEVPTPEAKPEEIQESVVMKIKTPVSPRNMIRPKESAGNSTTITPKPQALPLMAQMSTAATLMPRDGLIKKQVESTSMPYPETDASAMPYPETDAPYPETDGTYFPYPDSDALTKRISEAIPIDRLITSIAKNSTEFTPKPPQPIDRTYSSESDQKPVVLNAEYGPTTQDQLHIPLHKIQTPVSDTLSSVPEEPHHSEIPAPKPQDLASEKLQSDSAKPSTDHSVFNKTPSVQHIEGPRVHTPSQFSNDEPVIRLNARRASAMDQSKKMRRNCSTFSLKNRNVYSSMSTFKLAQLATKEMGFDLKPEHLIHSGSLSKLKRNSTKDLNTPNTPLMYLALSARLKGPEIKETKTETIIKMKKEKIKQMRQQIKVMQLISDYQKERNKRKSSVEMPKGKPQLISPRKKENTGKKMQRNLSILSIGKTLKIENSRKLRARSIMA